MGESETAMDYPRIPKELNVVMESEGGLETVCPWKSGADCPHMREDRSDSRKYGNSKIKESILDVVGNTPMVRCSNIAANEQIGCNLLAKCEFMNPGGAVKDRIGRRMVVDAINAGEWDGRPFKPGDVLIEPTSGNTGIGLSIAAAVKGLGATIVRTPTESAWDHEGSHISEAYK